MSAYVGGFLVTLKGLCKPEIRDSKQLFTLSSPNNFHKVPLVAAFCKGKMRHAAVGPFVEIQKHSHTSLFLHSNTTHFNDHTAQESYCTVVAQLHERSTLHLAWRRHHQFCGTLGHAEGTILPPIVNLPLLMRSHASSQKEVNLFAPAQELGRNGLSQVLVRRAPLTGSDPLGRATIPLVHFPTCQELQERRTCTARISKWSCLNFPEGKTSSLTGRQGKSKAEPSIQTKLSWILLPGEPPETLSARNILTYQTVKHFCISFDDCKWPWTSDGTWILSKTGRIRKAQQDLLSGKFWSPANRRTLPNFYLELWKVNFGNRQIHARKGFRTSKWALVRPRLVFPTGLPLIFWLEIKKVRTHLNQLLFFRMTAIGHGQQSIHLELVKLGRIFEKPKEIC